MLSALVLQALHQGALMLERLCHEWIVSWRLVLTLATLNDCLHDTGEGFIDYSGVAIVELTTYLLDRFAWVSAVEPRPLRQRLLLL